MFSDYAINGVKEEILTHLKNVYDVVIYGQSGDITPIYDNKKSP